jgi:ribosome-binding factor A
MNIRQKRVAQIILKEVSQMIQFEIKDNSLGIVTLLDVDLSQDYSYCTLYASFLDKSTDEQQQLARLNTHAKSMRAELGKRLTLRKIPQLRFVLDDTYEKGQRIDAIISSLHEEGKD